MIDFLLGLIDQFTHRKRECCTFRPGSHHYLILFDILFFNILSWALLLNKCLERKRPHITAKLDEHITFVSFWKNFLIPLSWLFSYDIFVIRAYYMFLRYKPTFLCYAHRVVFFQQWGEVNTAILYIQNIFAQFLKATHHFWSLLNSWHRVL